MVNNNQNLEEKIEIRDQRKEMPDEIDFIRDYTEHKLYVSNGNNYNSEVLIYTTSNDKDYDHLLW